MNFEHEINRAAEAMEHEAEAMLRRAKRARAGDPYAVYHVVLNATHNEQMATLTADDAAQRRASA